MPPKERKSLQIFQIQRVQSSSIRDVPTKFRTIEWLSRPMIHGTLRLFSCQLSFSMHFQFLHTALSLAQLDLETSHQEGPRTSQHHQQLVFIIFCACAYFFLYVIKKNFTDRKNENRKKIWRWFLIFLWFKKSIYVFSCLLFVVVIQLLRVKLFCFIFWMFHCHQLKFENIAKVFFFGSFKIMYKNLYLWLNPP